MIVVSAVIAGLAVRGEMVQLISILAAFGLLAAISFVDDLRGLAAAIRFAIHAAVAGLAVMFLADASPYTIILSGVGWLWITGYTNCFNFMDGINGIAGMQAVVTGIGTAAIACRLGVSVDAPIVWVSLAVAGAALGFLPHNFPRARVFMGDVSSAPLGFLLAVLAYWIAARTSFWVIFWIALLHTNFVLDTSVTLLRRARRGDRLHEAHREHFYQRLVRAGWSHTAVTLSEGGLQVFVAVALWWATPAVLATKVVVGVGVVTVWISFFAFAEMKFSAFARKQVEGAHATPPAMRRRSC